MGREETIDKRNHQGLCCGQSDNHKTAGHFEGPAPEDTSGSRLLVTLALNLIIPVAQIIGGLLANSVALVSDAVHNFSDFTALFISYIAYRIGRRGASISNTFGYRRAEIVAALINALLLIGASGLILYHAVHRFFNPQAIDGLMVIILAGAGVAGNGLSAWLLHRDSAHSLNVRGAYLHMVGDLMTSVAVLINGILLLIYPWYWLDPILSVLIVVFILKNAWVLIKESTAVLMNATPFDISVEKVREFLDSLPGVLGVHYLHAWRVSSKSTAFSCHVVVPDQPVSSAEKLAGKIRHELLHRFRIDHPVLQFETSDCGQGTLLCEMACNGDAACTTKVSSGTARIKPLVYHVLRLFMGAVWLYASYEKILYPHEFSQAVYNYQILPDMLVNLVALILPCLELLMGLCLITGLWLPGAVVLSTGLLSVFIAALVFNRIRGLDIHCGCFSVEATGGPADLWTVVRDAGFLVISAFLTWKILITYRSKDH